MTPLQANPWPQRWQRFASASVRGFHAYAGWLISISWRRFVVLGILLMVTSAILQNIPPFSWRWTRTVSLPVATEVAPPEAPEPPAPPSPAGGASQPAAKRAPPGVHIERRLGKDGVEITIDERGVRILAKPKAGSASAPAAPAAPAEAASAASAAASGTGPSMVTVEPGDSAASGARARVVLAGRQVVEIQLPPGEHSEAVKQAVEEARQSIDEAVREAQSEAESARAEAEAARADAEAARKAARSATRKAKQTSEVEVHEVSLGEWLPSLAMLWIVASAIIKVTYKKQVQAEAQAAQAVETAEAESLRRQVLEARMAAMQAQVEPHFLFNTLASIDHLIEVDPKRASQMQKNLIALLRASMPTMREASDGGARDLARELAVIKPYLEILKVRMEERLSTEIDVPEGLQSAEFPAMMVQTLVENAIKHGLEPKPEGGHLLVRGEIVHGKLAVTVADTGLGFGRAATAGTGVGLANIRERLQLLYGSKASLTIAENPGGGTRVTVSVPYKPLEGASA